MQEIIIRISPEIDREISPKISREIFKPILTKEQEVELVEKCLRLKAANVRGFNLQGIKWFYEKYFPKEFHGHNTNKDWDKCHLSSRKLVRLTKAFNEKNLILPQTFQEVQHSKELSEFTNERLFIPEISKKQKDEIINKSIFLAKTSKTPHIKTIKWFYRTYHYEYYKQYEKFNLWDNTGLRRKIVHMWVRRKKIEMAKKNQNKKHAQKFPTENIRLVEDIKEEIKHEPEVNIETVTYGESYEEKVEINVDESDQRSNSQQEDCQNFLKEKIKELEKMLVKERQEKRHIQRKLDDESKLTKNLLVLLLEEKGKKTNLTDEVESSNRYIIRDIRSSCLRSNDDSSAYAEFLESEKIFEEVEINVDESHQNYVDNSEFLDKARKISVQNNESKKEVIDSDVKVEVMDIDLLESCSEKPNFRQENCQMILEDKKRSDASMEEIEECSIKDRYESTEASSNTVDSVQIGPRARKR